jgi:hypothetical protein
VKSRQSLIYVFSLLLANLFPTTVYGGESSQSIGDDNNCPTQIINSERINITCNVTPSGNQDTPSVNPPNPVPEATESTYSSTDSGGLELNYTSPGSRSTSGGLEPNYTSPGSRSTSGGMEYKITYPGSI